MFLLMSVHRGGWVGLFGRGGGLCPGGSLSGGISVATAAGGTYIFVPYQILSILVSDLSVLESYILKFYELNEL